MHSVGTRYLIIVFLFFLYFCDHIALDSVKRLASKAFN